MSMTSMSREDFEALLLKEFPNLYDADMQGSMRTIYGIATGPGWYDIIYRLSHTLERLIMLEPKEERHHYKAAQIKEKFGSLRVFLSLSTEEMDMAISKAENDSDHTCEKCGEPGKTRSGVWIKTLCNDCSDERDKDRQQM